MLALKIFKGTPTPTALCATKFGQILERVKISGASNP